MCAYDGELVCWCMCKHDFTYLLGTSIWHKHHYVGNSGPHGDRSPIFIRQNGISEVCVCVCVFTARCRWQMSVLKNSWSLAQSALQSRHAGYAQTHTNKHTHTMIGQVYVCVCVIKERTMCETYGEIVMMEILNNSVILILSMLFLPF